eukprot:3309624-Amphidinium_carterae.1
MGPPPTSAQRKMPKGKGGSKSPADTNSDTAAKVVIPPWRSGSVSPSPKTQAAPPPKQAAPEVIAVLDLDSEDSWGPWGTADEPIITETLEFLKHVALDWAAEDWTTQTLAS